MKKGPNLRWSLIQCSGGDEGDRTPDLLTASQAPADARTILDNFASRGTGAGPRGPTVPDIVRGARHVAPGAAGQTKAIRGASGDLSPSARLRTIFGTVRSSPKLVAS